MMFKDKADPDEIELSIGLKRLADIADDKIQPGGLVMILCVVNS